jgi:hypothetical protein
MYWLETTSNIFYNEVNRLVFKDINAALEEYHRVIREMIEELPKEQWFDLKLMRHGKEGDFMPNRDQLVRSWVY